MTRVGPKVFVSRIIPDDGLRAGPRRVRRRRLAGRAAAAARRAPQGDRGLRRRPDAPHRRVDDEFLDRAGPQLKVVSNFAVGFDNIDVAACTARGVAVGNTPGVLTETTADLAWALLMAAARRLPEGDRYVRDGQLAHLGPDAAAWGRTSTARRSGSSASGGSGRRSRGARTGFGMRILYHDLQRASTRRSRRSTARPSCTLEELLPQVGLRDPPRQPQRPRRSGLINARAAGLDEADGRAREHVARARSSTRWRSPRRSRAAASRPPRST